jgi:hypothetical protein
MIHVSFLQVEDGDHKFIAEIDGIIVGSLSVRLVPLAHSLEVKQGMISRRIAEALIHYANGYTRASGFTDGLIAVEAANKRMLAFLEDQRAARDSNVELFTVSVG